MAWLSVFGFALIAAPTPARASVSEPTVQASNLWFEFVSNTSLFLHWTRGNGTSSVVFAKAASSGTATPVDDTAYTANTAFGSGAQIGSTGWYAVYSGTSTSVTVTGLSATTNYVFQVFELNSSDPSFNYLTSTATSNPATQRTTTVAANLLSNPGGEAGSLTGWSVTNGGSGWGVSGGSYRYEGDRSFIASYAWGTLSQTINLVSAGFTAEYLDTAPQIDASTYVAATTGWKAGCTTDPYSFKVELRNGSGGVIASYNTGAQNATATWAKVGQTFTGYGAGVRTIYFEQRGADCEYWGGDYGVLFDGAWLSVANNITTYNLNYSAGTGGSITGSSSQTVVAGNDGSAVTAVPSTGYHFVRWSDASITNPRTDTGVATNVTVSAEFTINTYQAKYAYPASSVSGGSVSGGSEQTIDYGGQNAAVTAVPDTGFSFVRWSDGVTANPRTDTNITEDLSVYPVFQRNNYTLTYTAGEHGAISGSTTQTVAHGSDGGTVWAIPDSGYVFSGWSDGGTANPRTDTGLRGNLSLSATFTPTTAATTTTTTATATNTSTVKQTAPSPVNSSSADATATTPAANATATSLTVRVMSNGQPVAGVTVELHSTVQTAVTDSNGYATFANVEPGEHTVKVVYANQSVEKSVTVDPSSSQVDMASDNASTVNLNIELPTTNHQSSSQIWWWILALAAGGLFIKWSRSRP